MNGLARALTNEVREYTRSALPPRLRSMREFAEAEIVLPNGPYEGRRFRCEYQPVSRLWFDAVESGHWTTFVATGPSQSGKTLSCSIVPLLFHLFEIGETVIFGIPDLEMVSDKWREDILPVVERTRYRDLLPTYGAGSRGGRVESIRFRNGATLRFMTGGGGDKSRAAYTSRVLIITETDGMDQAGKGSREADKIRQLIARTRSFGSARRIYMECTLTTPEGRTWREIQRGTASRIMLRCPRCQQYVHPEREHLLGWRDTPDELAAHDGSAFCCPGCGAPWTAGERAQANRDAVLLHKGQTVGEDGVVMGDLPRTRTLGFRYSAVNNLFVSAGDVGVEEWRRSLDEENESAERELCQFIWALPYEAPVMASANLELDRLAERHRSGLRRGFVPAGAESITIGVDLGKYLAHWIAIAWSEHGAGHVVDFDRFELASDRFGVDRAIYLALQEWAASVAEGWPVVGGESDEERRMVPSQVWIDAGYQPDPVYGFCREMGTRYRPTKGYGATQEMSGRYLRPKSTGSVVRYIGEGYHFSRLKSPPIDLAEVDADHWKTWLHQRLATPLDEKGAMTFFELGGRGSASFSEHALSFLKHLTAEKQVQEFVAGRGLVTRWERIRRQNHWLDAAMLACAAGHFCGARLLGASPRATTRSPVRPARARDARRSGYISNEWRRH